MLELTEANWIAFVAALLIGIVIAWWLFARGSRPVERERRPDAMDEGAAPAKRNQALIDAPPAADIAPPAPPAHVGTMAGMGEIVGAAAHDEVANKAEHDLAEAAAAREEAEAKHDPALDAAPAAPQPEPSAPSPAATPASSPAPDTDDGDDLRRIKGIGPKLAAQLQALGVTRYRQIAAWSDDDLTRIDDQLGAFKGRPRRDNWIEQAKLLESGDTGAYEAKFGKL